MQTIMTRNASRMTSVLVVVRQVVFAAASRGL